MTVWESLCIHRRVFQSLQSVLWCNCSIVCWREFHVYYMMCSYRCVVFSSQCLQRKHFQFLFSGPFSILMYLLHMFLIFCYHWHLYAILPSWVNCNFWDSTWSSVEIKILEFEWWVSWSIGEGVYREVQSSCVGYFCGLEKFHGILAIW